MKKTILFLLLFAMLISVVSCSNDSKTTETSTETTTQATEINDSQANVFQKSELPNFKIAYSTNLGEAAVEKVNSFAEDIKTFCNVEIVVTSDFIVPTNNKLKEWDNEILIGLTNREESKTFAEQLRGKDYGYCCVDGKIIICGGNDQATIEAMDAFLVNVVVAHLNETMFYSSEWNQIEWFAYELQEITINGISLNRFEVFYPADGTMMEKQMAQAFCNMVADKMGIELSCKPDNESKSADQAILFGKTKYSQEEQNTLQTAQGCILRDGNNLVIFAKDASGIIAGEKKLVDLLLSVSETEKKKEVTITEPLLTEVQKDYSVMTFNIKTGDMNQDRMERVLSTFTKYMPDVIGIQEANPSWMTYLSENLSGYYAFVGLGREGDGNGEHTCILYAKDKFNLIESGTKWLTSTPDSVSKMAGAEYYRIFTYALLEDKTTGERFLHLNTHLDTASSEIRVAEVKLIMQFLGDYNSVPVIFTGDMNSTLTSKELKLVQNRSFATVTGFPELSQSTVIGKGSHVIDYIFVTPDAVTLTYYTTDNYTYNGDYASDHFGYYATFTLKKIEGTLDHGWDVEINDYPEGWLVIDKDKDKEDFGKFIFVP